MYWSAIFRVTVRGWRNLPEWQMANAGGGWRILRRTVWETSKSESLRSNRWACGEWPRVPDQGGGREWVPRRDGAQSWGPGDITISKFVGRVKCKMLTNIHLLTFDIQGARVARVYLWRRWKEDMYIFRLKWLKHKIIKYLVWRISSPFIHSLT